MRRLVLIAIVVSTQLAYGAPAKPQHPHAVECCRSTEPSRLLNEIEKARKEGKDVYADPRIKNALLTVLEYQFKEMNINFDFIVASRLLNINPEAFLLETKRMYSIFIDPTSTSKEKEITRKSWDLSKAASASIESLVKNEAEAKKAIEDVVTVIEISRAIATLNSVETFQPFLEKYERALMNGASVKESISIASGGEFTENQLRESFRAAAVLPVTRTSTVTDASVYVEYVDGILYYHSNFVAHFQTRDDRPNKLPTNVKGDPKTNPELANLATAFAKIIGTARNDSAGNVAVRQALLGEVQVLLDLSIFDGAGVPRIDLTGVKNFQFVNARRNQTLDISSEMMETVLPPPSLIAKIKGCCLYGRPPHWSPRMSEVLSKQRFDPKNIRIASLFIESATDREIEHSNLVKNVRVKGDSKQVKSEIDLKNIFVEAKGRTLVLLGHVEGADYVIRTSANVEQLRVPIANVRAMAKGSGVQLIDIGCQTTKVIREEAFGFGVMTNYRSVEAVKSLELAMEKAKTVEDFLVILSSEGLKIVLEPSFLKDPVKTASVYSRIRDASKAVLVKVAQVTFSNFKQ